MRYFEYVAIVIITILFQLLTGCGGPPEITPETIDEYDYVVARFDTTGYQVSAPELYDKIFYSELLPGGGVTTDSTIADFLDSLLLDTLIGLEAATCDLSENWWLHKELKDHMTSLIMRAFLDLSIYPEVLPDSAEVIEYYGNNTGSFAFPERTELYHILSSPRRVSDSEDSAKVLTLTEEERWELAEENIRRLYLMLELGEDFQGLALRHSHDAYSRDNAGRLGWITRGTYGDPADSLAFALAPGEFTEPFQDNVGWHILLISDRILSGILPLDSPGVFLRSHNALLQQKVQNRLKDIVDSMRQTMELRMNREAFETDLGDLRSEIWMGIVNDVDTIYANEVSTLEEGFKGYYLVSRITPDIYEKMVDTLSGHYLLLQAARSIGIDTLPRITGIRKIVKHRKCKDMIYRPLLASDPWEPTDSTIDEYYQVHIDEFVPPRPLTAGHLCIADSALAVFLAEQAKTGMDLADIATEFGKSQGYDVKVQRSRPVGPDNVESWYYGAVCHKGAGDAVGPVRSPEGRYYVIKIVGKRQTIMRSMADGRIRALLRDEHKRQKWEAFRDDYFDRYDVKILRKLPAFKLPPKSEGRYIERPDVP
ncbi:MAG: hypothetical protein DRP45_04125 [Candidatus Zixiibacteriota bacterium]|nr:MAG: hypothetical protein DRP45_04125 [candidate division Zixibacteria bacterium]